jgi:predicted nuclease of predicted toxin-antitoxin system
MRILVDENIPNVTIEYLRSVGHDVLLLRGTSAQGMTDEALWAQAQRERRLVVSTDKGFVAHRSEKHCGLLIVRLRQPNEQKIHMRITRAMTQFEEQAWPGLLVVMRDRTQSVWRAK